ncbi:MAG: argininosuccinate lyase [Rhodothermales bacterium]
MSSIPLWQKTTRVEDWVTRFTVGEDYRWDTLLLPYDIQATREHAWGLTEIGVLSEDELEQAVTALERLLEAVSAGGVTVHPRDEDGHTVIENYLTAEIGDVGKKIHTGRSRNDQVLAAIRLFLRDRLRGIASRAADVARVLCDWGREHDRSLMPGYTHLQHAMPSTVGLWAMGYAELLVFDIEGLVHARDRINVSPLGSAAGYGVPYLALPREEVAKRLGFTGVQTHVTSVQLSRGKLELEVVHALVQLGATYNRLASDLVLYNTTEFGFVKLPPEYCTGSSIMPQKQNPDVLELVRAVYHRLTAEMHLLVTLPANLPSGYHRDLQLTKEAVMRAVLTAENVTEAMANVVQGISFNEERLDQATSKELFATARALELVSDGIPFRDAYRRAADEVESLVRPDAEAALDSYQVDGYPGRCRPDLVLERLDNIKF